MRAARFLARPVRPVALSATVSVALLLTRPVFAERQVRGFLGVAFASATTFLDLEDAIRVPHRAVGGGVTWLGNLVGFEIEASWVPGFFERGPRALVTRSGVHVVTSAVVVALPRRLTEYSLRPYGVVGGGWMQVRMEDAGRVFRFTRNRPAVAFGGGATGFVTERVGLNWDVRLIHMVPARQEESGVSFGPPRLRFWRGSMAVAVRY